MSNQVIWWEMVKTKHEYHLLKALIGPFPACKESVSLDVEVARKYCWRKLISHYTVLYVARIAQGNAQ